MANSWPLYRQEAVQRHHLPVTMYEMSYLFREAGERIYNDLGLETWVLPSPKLPSIMTVDVGLQKAAHALSSNFLVQREFQLCFLVSVCSIEIQSSNLYLSFWGPADIKLELLLYKIISPFPPL